MEYNYYRMNINAVAIIMINKCHNFFKFRLHYEIVSDRVSRCPNSCTLKPSAPVYACRVNIIKNNRGPIDRYAAAAVAREQLIKSAQRYTGDLIAGPTCWETMNCRLYRRSERLSIRVGLADTAVKILK